MSDVQRAAARLLLGRGVSLEATARCVGVTAERLRREMGGRR